MHKSNIASDGTNTHTHTLTHTQYTTHARTHIHTRPSLSHYTSKNHKLIEKKVAIDGVGANAIAVKGHDGHRGHASTMLSSDFIVTQFTAIISFHNSQVISHANETKERERKEKKKHLKIIPDVAAFSNEVGGVSLGPC